MAPSAQDKTIEWLTEAVRLTLAIDDEGAVTLRSFAPRTSAARASQSPYFAYADLPLHSVRLAGEGSQLEKSAKSLVGSCLSARLRYESHQTTTVHRGADAAAVQEERLDVSSLDAQTGLRVTQHFVAYGGCGGGAPVLRCWATATNTHPAGAGPTLALTQLSSVTVGGLTTGGPRGWSEAWTLWTATNTWFREAQWRAQTLPEVGIDETGVAGLDDNGRVHQCSQAVAGLSSRGSFSTGTYLPLGLLAARDGADTWFWQVEHNGSWRWELSDFRDAVYLCAGGPTAADHDWTAALAPGASVDSVPVALGRVAGDWQAAFAALTTYRRAMRRPHADMARCPIIFNDYMNCLMGDPDEAKILALLDYAADAGAEYFVIDCGWYADDTAYWWDTVGEWAPSAQRFPSGLRALLDAIRARGLVPGLWIEPEVVGVHSPVAFGTLPEAAFFHERGVRVAEKGRFQLDFRHPAVVARMTRIVDGLVTDYGAGYFKFDYNIEVLQGTDDVPPGENTAALSPPSSPGAAHLDHHRAYLAWVRSLLDRHPGLVIESCSSGGQRCDYAQLAVHPLHSTSDQQDPALYAAIAAAVPTAVTPEQGATWAYPQPGWDDETNALTVANSLLGRVHLSGRLDRLAAPHQTALVRDGMRVYADILRPRLPTAQPFWPLGLPRWHDEWVALGMRTTTPGPGAARDDSDEAFLTVWRRAKKTTREKDENDKNDVNDAPPSGTVELPLPRAFATAELLYPTQLATEYGLAADNRVLRVTLPALVGARVFRLRNGD